MTDAFEFQGFEPSNTTAVPDVFFDELLSEISGAELRALLYIIRRTLGFKKTTDSISLNQFLNGITTKEKKVLDKGCGIKDRHTLLRVLKSLEYKWNCIESEKVVNEKGECEPTLYRIKFRTNGVECKPTLPVQSGSVKNTTTTEGKTPLPEGDKSTLPVVGKTTPTRNSNTTDRLQQTDKQENTIAPDVHTPNISQPSAIATAAIAHAPSSQQIQDFATLPAKERDKVWNAVPVTYAEALDYLKAHGTHEGLDASQVMLLARKLYAESQQSPENDNHSHLEQTNGDDHERLTRTVHNHDDDHPAHVGQLESVSPLALAAPGRSASIPQPQAQVSAPPTTVGGITQEKPPRAARKPPAPKRDDELEKRIDTFFDCLDTLARETTPNAPDFTYSRTKKARQEIGELLKGRKVSEKSLRAVYMDMYNSPRDTRTGFAWKDNMSVSAICRHYDTRLLSVKSKQPQSSTSSSCEGQAPTNSLKAQNDLLKAKYGKRPVTDQTSTVENRQAAGIGA